MCAVGRETTQRLFGIFDHLMKGVNVVFSNLPQAADSAGDLSFTLIKAMEDVANPQS